MGLVILSARFAMKLDLMRPPMNLSENPATRSTSILSIHRVLYFAGISLLCFFPGCQSQRAEPVNAEIARRTLNEVLETWKTGGTIAQLSDKRPTIVVQDIDWSRGSRLQEFRVLDQGREEDANLFCEVELILIPVNSQTPVKKTVTYVIGTDPVLTVFRAIL